MDDESTPPDLCESANNAVQNLMPDKSKKIYTLTYNNFTKWRTTRGTELASERVLLAYFMELNEKYKPSSLWAIYSMLKCTLSIHENIDINKYEQLSSFLKKQSRGFKSKKSRVLSNENINQFISEAPDEVYLVTKVALIFGIMGACRSQELRNCELKHVIKQDEIFIVHIPETKTNKPRTFTINKNYVNIVEKYLNLRNTDASTNSFFLRFDKGKCTTQVIGRKTFAKMPQEIAKYLKLENPETFTGHCFRRTGATVVANTGATMDEIMKYGGWESSRVAKGYVERLIQNKRKLGDTIVDAINSTNSNHEINTDELPTKIIRLSSSDGENTNDSMYSADSSNSILIDETSPTINSNMTSYCNNTETFSLDGGFLFQNCNMAEKEDNNDSKELRKNLVDYQSYEGDAAEGQDSSKLLINKEEIFDELELQDFANKPEDVNSTSQDKGVSNTKDVTLTGSCNNFSKIKNLAMREGILIDQIERSFKKNEEIAKSNAETAKQMAAVAKTLQKLTEEAKAMVDTLAQISKDNLEAQRLKLKILEVKIEKTTVFDPLG